MTKPKVYITAHVTDPALTGLRYQAERADGTLIPGAAETCMANSKSDRFYALSAVMRVIRDDPQWGEIVLPAEPEAPAGGYQDEEAA